MRTIIVESANRFARDLVVQLTGHDYLQRLGIELIPADAPDHFRDETPTAVMIRQILGAVAQFEKASLVAKLKGARDRKRRRTGSKVEGRKTLAEKHPEAVAMARHLREKTPRMSLREISAALTAAGIVTKPSKGKKRPGGLPYTASAVASMLAC